MYVYVCIQTLVYSLCVCVCACYCFYGFARLCCIVAFASYFFCVPSGDSVPVGAKLP